MLLHIIKLLLEFLTTGYTIVITGYAVTKIIIKFSYKNVDNGRTANENFLAIAELIKKEEKHYRRINAALQGSRKNTSVEISSNVVEQQFTSVNTQWKRKRFPLLKTGNNNFSRILIPLIFLSRSQSHAVSRGGLCLNKTCDINIIPVKNLKISRTQF